MQNSDQYFLQFNGDADEERTDTELLRSARHTHDLLKVCGCRPKISLRMLSAVFQVEDETINRDALLEKTVAFFRHRAILIPHGLQTVPSSWLINIPQALLQTLKPEWCHVPYMITHLSLCRGTLCVSFAQEGERGPNNRITRWDQLRMTLNRSVRPNLWTGLAAAQRNLIWDRRPDLREELLGFSPAANPNLS